MAIGNNIREKRIQMGITQKALAEMAGIPQITLRQYEAEKYSPKFETLEKIAKALDVSVDCLRDGAPAIPEGYVSIAELKEACKVAAETVEYCRSKEYEIFQKKLREGIGGAVILNDHAKAVSFFESRFCFYHFDVPALIDAVANGTWKEDTDGTEKEEA